MKRKPLVFVGLALVVLLRYPPAQGRQAEPDEAPLERLDDTVAILTKGDFDIDLSDVDPKVLKALKENVGVGRPADAAKAMDVLEKENGTPEGARRVTRVYVALGKDFERQLAELPEDRKPERQALLDGLEATMTRLIPRPAHEFNSLNWIAETFYALGSGTEARGQPTKESKRYFTHSAAALQRMLAEMEKDPKFGPQNTATVANLRDQHKLFLQIRQAQATRRTGDFEAAIQSLGRILEGHPRLLEGQVEAAYLLQAWGPVDIANYPLAMNGHLKRADPKTKREENQIWGWARMSTVMEKAAAKDKTLLSWYFEARFNLNYCRYVLSLSEKEPDAKRELLDAAEADMQAVVQRYPNIDQDWEARYRQLFRSVMQLNNKTGTLGPKKD